MKACKTCGVAKPEDSYYRQKSGRMSSCKACIKARARKHRADNLERVREYDRARGLLPERKAAVRARAHKYIGKYTPYKETHPERRAAHIMVGNAIKAGTLKPTPCERCSFPFGIHAHHEDYAKPLEVNWLCVRCHGKRHREINEERRRVA